jgi:broad specificity phosphatase PhoE
MTHALEYVAARHRGRSAIVVSHGGVMSLTLPRIARDSGVPMHAPPTLAHGAVLQIEAGEDTWRFTSRWGD